MAINGASNEVVMYLGSGYYADPCKEIDVDSVVVALMKVVMALIVVVMCCVVVC